MKFMQRALCAAICCALSAGAMAASEPPPTARTDIDADADTAEQAFLTEAAAYAANVEQALERSTNAHDLMLVSTILGSEVMGEEGDSEADAKVRAKRDRLAERAMAHANDDVAAWWRIHLYCTTPEASCDAEAALQRVRSLDPTNAMVWSTGQADASATTFDESLMAAAKADHWNSYFSDTVLHNIAVFDAHPLPPTVRLMYAPDKRAFEADAEFSVTAALISAIAEFATTASPGLMTKTCLALAPDDARRSDCRVVADIMAHRSDGFRATRPGTTLLIALAETPAEHAAALDACRDTAWLMSKRLDADQKAVSDELSTSLYRDPGNNELTVRRAAFEANGIPTSAPRDWTTRMCDAPAVPVTRS